MYNSKTSSANPLGGETSHNGKRSQFEIDCDYEAKMHNLLYKNFYSKLEELGARIEKVYDLQRQKLGIDTILHKPDGSDVYIDEKAREKADKGTFGLEIWNNYGGKGNFTKGWFMDESKLTGWYCFLHTENRINYATLVRVKDLKHKVFSILTKEELNDFNSNANKAVKSKLPGAFVYDSNQWEHGRFLILPLEFYKSIPSTMQFTLG